MPIRQYSSRKQRSWVVGFTVVSALIWLDSKQNQELSLEFRRYKLTNCHTAANTSVLDEWYLFEYFTRYAAPGNHENKCYSQLKRSNQKYIIQFCTTILALEIYCTGTIALIKSSSIYGASVLLRFKQHRSTLNTDQFMLRFGEQ